MHTPQATSSDSEDGQHSARSLEGNAQRTGEDGVAVVFRGLGALKLRAWAQTILVLHGRGTHILGTWGAFQSP